MRLILFVILFCSHYTSSGQDYFTKVIDLDRFSQGAKQLIPYNEQLFLLNYTTCENNSIICSELMEIDFFGNIIKQLTIEEVDPSRNSMLIENDTIYIVGNDYKVSNKFILAKIPISLEDGYKTYQIQDKNNIYNTMFELGFTKFENQFIIAGNGRDVDTEVDAIMYWVDQNGVVDSLMSFKFDGFLGNRINNCYVDNNNLLTIYTQYGAFSTKYYGIKKFNSAMQEVWSWTSPQTLNDNITPCGFEMEDGRMIIELMGDDNDPNAVWAINPDGTVSWQYKWPKLHKRRIISRLKPLSNGDILGCGIYGEYQEEPIISPYTGNLFRLSPEGGLIWEKAYYQEDSVTGKVKTAQLEDFVELDNGDIIAVGGIFNRLTDPVFGDYNQQDILIIRVDENGCMVDDCDEKNILTKTVDIASISYEVSLYPNPTQNFLNIKGLPNAKYGYNIHNTQGAEVQKGKLDDQSINTSSLENGIYFLQIWNDKGVVFVDKFKKME